MAYKKRFGAMAVGVKIGGLPHHWQNRLDLV